VFEEIDPRSPVPLYEQIAGRIRVAVTAEEYRAGEPLPSVRQLASALRVNPATVVQAYRDLERDGFVEMRHGAGTFVQALTPDRKRSEHARQARELVRRFIDEGARLGIRPRELKQAFEDEIEGSANV
jgi:GntR family transcriptional regulator